MHFFFVGLVFKGAFSFCNRCASPCRTQERRCQYLVGGYFAIVIQDMFEGATKLAHMRMFTLYVVHLLLLFFNVSVLFFSAFVVRRLLLNNVVANVVVHRFFFFFLFS